MRKIDTTVTTFLIAEYDTRQVDRLKFYQGRHSAALGSWHVNRRQKYLPATVGCREACQYPGTSCIIGAFLFSDPPFLDPGMMKSDSIEASSANEFPGPPGRHWLPENLIYGPPSLLFLVAPSIELRGAGAPKSGSKRTDPPPLYPCRRS